MEYLMRLAHESSDRTFEALVTEVRPHGILVELVDLFAKGLIRREDLPGRDPYFDANRAAFVSHRPDYTVQMGQHLQVKVEKVDPDKGWIDFRPVF